MLIPIIIPSYEPDDRLIALLDDFYEAHLGPVIIVDDGSGENYQEIFSLAENKIRDFGGVLLHHEENSGKGRALKTAFQYVLDMIPEAVGVITCDSDGQHNVASILKVKNAMLEYPDTLIMGSRDLTGEGVPWKSRTGNRITARVFSYVAGSYIQDTQTGLRGIPCNFMRELMSVKGERFEYEMRMLLTAVKSIPVQEVLIETIYDSATNHQSHFHAVKDSVRIYKILLEAFFRFLFSSLSSCVIDLGLFTLFSYLLRDKVSFYIFLATVISRVISATYNYALNYKVVFQSKETVGKSGIKYLCLAIVQMMLSAFLVTGGKLLLPFFHETWIKMIVDVLLFFVSYKIQQKFVFQRGE